MVNFVLKGNWWIFVTVPLLALAIYLFTEKIKFIKKQKRMTGVSIFSITFGITLIVFSMLKQGKLDKFNIFFGICWILLGAGRLFYDHKIKR